MVREIPKAKGSSQEIYELPFVFQQSPQQGFNPQNPALCRDNILLLFFNNVLVALLGGSRGVFIRNHFHISQKTCY